MSKKQEPKTLSEAIEQLEGSAGEKAQDVKNILDKNLKEIMGVLKELQPQVKEIQGRIEGEVSERKNQLEGKIKENPWIAIGVVGILAFILGLIFSGIAKSSDDRKGGNPS